MTRSFFARYVVLVGACAVTSSRPAWQLGFLALYWMSLTREIVKERIRCTPVWHVARSAWISQIPGMAAALGSAAAIRFPHLGEWFDGLLELWVCPYMPLLEDFFPGRETGLSRAYLAACGLPFAMTVVVAAGAVFAGLSLRRRKKGGEAVRETA